MRATPLEAATPGVEIHAQIIESLVSGTLLSRPDWAAGAEFFAALLLFAIVMALGAAIPPMATALIVAATCAALFLASFVIFDRHGLLIDALYPSAAIIGGYVVGGVTLFQFERAAKRHVHRAFGKFLSPVVVERLAENPDRLVLGGETRELTVLFSDLRNFSALSEGLSARELTQFMNDYLTPMTDSILDRDGTVDKYIGDAIMAFWNAPLDVPAHAAKAVAAALAMRAALADFNAARGAKAALAGEAWQPVDHGNWRQRRPLQRWKHGVDAALRLFGARRRGEPRLAARGRQQAVRCRHRRLGERARRGAGRRVAGAGRDRRDRQKRPHGDLHHRRRRRTGANRRVWRLARRARRHARTLPNPAIWRGRRDRDPAFGASCSVLARPLYATGKSIRRVGRRAAPGRLDSGVDFGRKVRRATRMIDEIVKKCWSQLAADHAPGAFEALDAGYGAREGGYHDWSHIAHLLRALDAFRGLAARPALVATAAFWHDAVYVTREPDGRRRRDVENVRASAELFRRHALFNARDADAVHEMIMATANHMRAEASQARYAGFGGDLELFLDLDLSPLAVPWKKFVANLNKIRHEAALPSDLEFYASQLELLEGFLKPDARLFRRDEARSRWLGPARANIERCVRELRAKLDAARG